MACNFLILQFLQSKNCKVAGPGCQNCVQILHSKICTHVAGIFNPRDTVSGDFENFKIARDCVAGIKNPRDLCANFTI